MGEMHRERVVSALASGAVLQVYPVLWDRESRGGHCGTLGWLFLGTAPELQSTLRMPGCAGSAAWGGGRWLKRNRQRGFSAADTIQSNKPTASVLGWG